MKKHIKTNAFNLTYYSIFKNLIIHSQLSIVTWSFNDIGENKGWMCMQTKTRVIVGSLVGLLLLWGFGCTEDSDPVGTLQLSSPIRNEAVTNSLKVQKMMNRPVETVDFEESAIVINPANGEEIFCAWRAVAYRISQICAQIWDDNTFYSYQIELIETGWNTDCGIDLFTDILGIPAERVIIPEDSTLSKDLSLGDSWYEITFDNGRTLLFQTTENIYHERFLTWRDRYMNGDPTMTAKMVEQEREKVKQALRTLPFTDNFIIQEQ